MSAQSAADYDSLRKADRSEQRRGVLAIVAGLALTGGFYAVVFATGWSALERYFLGHPVAVAATALFFVAVAILGTQFLFTRRQWRLFHIVADQELAPEQHSQRPSDQFRQEHEAGFVAQQWSETLNQLSASMKRSALVVRLKEVLLRQGGRGTSKHLADDLRELSARDADLAHDSFALVRIIVWAIPMLGFLGTVIGITQTLGGLDFSSGNAAVDNLKSGLYVAFDTTALGLVLSVVAIFLQFPVERSGQRLLAAIDERVGHLTGKHLPGDEAADNQFAMLAQLYEGIRVAVADSLANQTTLWRQTIDEAQTYWQQGHTAQSEAFLNAIEQTMVPALQTHADQLDQSAGENRQKLDESFYRWQQQLNAWQESMVTGAESMTRQQALLVDQADQAAQVRDQAATVLQLQNTLVTNIDALNSLNGRIDENLGAAAGHGMVDAMVLLARAVDQLNQALVENAHQSVDNPRHAA
ncbi:MotA/TolQ/ExbB proton channel family protein [Stieleria bergensis]